MPQHMISLYSTKITHKLEPVHLNTNLVYIDIHCALKLYIYQAVGQYQENASFWTCYFYMSVSNQDNFGATIKLLTIKLLNCIAKELRTCQILFNVM